MMDEEGVPFWCRSLSGSGTATPESSALLRRVPGSCRSCRYSVPGAPEMACKVIHPSIVRGMDGSIRQTDTGKMLFVQDAQRVCVP